MKRQLKKIAGHAGYWLALVALGLSLEGVALYYQYVLDELPCVLCIQVRLWVAAMIIVALLAMVIRSNTRAMMFSHTLITLVAAALVERSYQLLGTERGWTFGSCGFDLGLPAWFSIDNWLPALFRVETSCGYTPELVAGITMAEGLLALSSILLLTSIALLLSLVSSD